MKKVFMIVIFFVVGIFIFIYNDNRPIVYKQNFKSIDYESVVDYSYFQPDGQTVNLKYTYTDDIYKNIKFYGNSLPKDIVVMSQFDKKIIFLNKDLTIKWVYPSGGRFVRVIDNKIYASNEFDVKIIDIINLDGILENQIYFPYEINNIQYYDNMLLVVPNLNESKIFLYEFNSKNLRLGSRIYESKTVAMYPRDAIINNNLLYTVDTFGHKIIVEDIKSNSIKSVYDTYFPNEIQIIDDYLYILEEHNDRLISINLKTSNKNVSFAPSLDLFWNTDSLIVPKSNLICKEGNFFKSIVSDTCLGIFTLYSPNGFRILTKEEGLGVMFADTDNHRILYFNGNNTTVITGFNNPVKFDIVR
ncbi:NHL repeat-containing protein [Aliarcobacter butzleri]|uniref:hypothetical protein n=1 Tax=Aliarcobacter butzleri TaxID=28197 RepID=UPI0021B45A2C|nr:hypothetical protein [Aliarcobacter butzleri]MCT7646453.1 hypothetical protein [Aliarcobacter butzleri]